MAEIVGVQFNNTLKAYYFNPKNEKYSIGDKVVVETIKGIEMGVISIANKEVDDSEIVQPLKEITRRATEKDLKTQKENKEKIPNIIRITKEECRNLQYDMKIIDAEIPLDNSKVIIYFVSPSRVDFRELVKVLAKHFHHRIDLRQVGNRDEIKVLGGIAPCGRVCCCHEFLSEQKKVTIKMAKNQGISLNPAKISGLCGKLMCCLEYENENYVEALKQMPKVGSQIDTKDGHGIVILNNTLTMTTRIKLEKENGAYEFKDYDVKELEFKNKVNVEEDSDDTNQEEI